MYNLDEANIAHLRKKFKNNDICMISASRNNYNREQKRDKNRELRDELKNSPYEVITIEGGYLEDLPNGGTVDVKERSFFVVNYSNYDKNKTKAFEDLMFHLCNKYQQDSIFIKTDNYPAGIYDSNRQPLDFGNGLEINKTKTNVKSDLPFYSRVNGTKFTFESCEKSEFRKLVEEVLKENGFTLD